MASRKKRSSEEHVVETTHDEIGFWSEIKLDILKAYWPEYTKIVKKQSWNFHTLYVDAFAGSGQHVSRSTREFVMGSPARALQVSPPFDEYHFIDMDDAKVKSLEKLAEAHSNVVVHHSDCNQILLKEIFPLADYKKFRRAVCLLDPYSLQLDWNVTSRAGQMQSVEIFLNFPMMDMNRNVFHGGASEAKMRQMSKFWGDESWREVAYRQRATLFGTDTEKASNRDIALAFVDRLKTAGRFQYVPEPLAMRNSTRATVYYLFFAGNNKTGAKIVDWIFKDYRAKGYG